MIDLKNSNPRNIVSAIAVFSLLPAIPFLFFLFAVNQIAPVFGEENQIDGFRVRLYPLRKRHSIKIQSRSCGEQRNISSPKPTKVAEHPFTPKSRVKINELFLVPACNIKPRSRLGKQERFPIHARRKARGIEPGKGIRNVVYLSSMDPVLSENNGGGGEFSSNEISFDKIQVSVEKKLEGAGGTLGSFFEGGFSTPAKGAYRIEVTPRISIRGEYDDNILLVNANPLADYKTIVSPGIRINASSDSTGLELDYEFGWVKYHKRSKNDYTQHEGRLRFWQQVAKNLKFSLDDYYIRSNDYLAAINQVPVTQRVANTLSAYQRNNARAALDYQFGPKNHFVIGYKYNILDNDDASLEDAKEHGPFTQLTYYFTQKDGLDLSYENLRYIYDQPDYIYNWRDINEQKIRGRYIHHFDAHTSASAEYGLSIRKSIDYPIEYEVHDVAAGFSHAFSQSLSMDFGLGYFKPTGDISLNSGVSSLLRIRKAFERGSLELGGGSGWDQGLMEVVPRGFTRFSSVYGGIQYDLLETLELFANGSYRKNRYANELINELLNQSSGDETYQGRVGFDWRAYRWFTLRLDYLYTNRTSPDPQDEFVDNRIGLTLIAEESFKW